MRIRMIAAFTLASLGLTASHAAQLQQGSPLIETCVRPAAPDLSVAAGLTGRARVDAYNAATRRFNDYVSAVNAHFACAGAEAEADLAAYHASVVAALDAEQTAVLAEVEALRAALKAQRR